MILNSHGFLHLVERFGPGVVGVMAGLEATGLPLPAESLLIATSAYAGSTGKISIAWIIVAAATGAIVGDNIGYLIGHSVGYAALHRWGRHVGLTDERLTLGRYLFKRHGGKVVFFGRFVAFLRTLAALLAGANRMPWPHFLVSNAAGGIVWACLYGGGAYWLGDEIKRISGPAAGVLLGAAVIGAVAAFVYLRRNEARLIATAQREMEAAPSS